MNPDLKIKAYDLRKNILDIVMAGRCGHIGGDMSVLEVLMTLYDRIAWRTRTGTVLSSARATVWKRFTQFWRRRGSCPCRIS